MKVESSKSSSRGNTLEEAARRSAPGKIALPPDSLLNPEMSDLAFESRVLDLASDARIPLLERVRFVAIFGGNVDEFFMTRVAGFKRQIALRNERRTIDGLTPGTQLEMIRTRVDELLERVYGNVLPDLLAGVSASGVELLTWSTLEESERAYLNRNYSRELDAVIAPVFLASDAPFPHVRNLRPALFVESVHSSNDERHFSILELPSDVPRLIPLPGGRRFIALEEVLAPNLARLLDASEIISARLFRVTRSGNLTLEGDDGDVVEAVAENIAKRPFQPVVRIEVESSMSAEHRYRLLHELQLEARARLSELTAEDVYPIQGLIDLNRLTEIAALPIPELRYPPLKRRAPFRRRPSIFRQIRRKTALVHFPGDSFEKSAERFIWEAAHDPTVSAISITLYRTNRTSRIVRLLRKAHLNGKRVIALIEVKASFDERRNIEWARALESAGIRVLYGPPTMKIHAKIATVARREEEGTRLYSLVGTGNLNAATAAEYTDLTIFTADTVVGEELQLLFDAMAGSYDEPHFEWLLVAPFNMRTRFIEMIERESRNAQEGRPARISVKINGLADREFIAALYRASRCGVQIDLLVRGICILRPGVPGLSENIRVVAVAGRFLEHSRIFRFENAGRPEFYLGSADWRRRNLSRRVEVITPVREEELQQELDRILNEQLEQSDAWELQSDGAYVRRQA